MKALGIQEPTKAGGLKNQMRELDLPLPEPGKGEIRVRVHASTINIDDIHIAEGTMIGGLPVTPKASALQPLIPGTDVAGTVDAVGPGVADYEIGQRVLGISRPSDGRGPWAEYCILRAADVMEIPDNANYNDVVAFPLSGSVAVDCIAKAGDPRGKTCLVIGASGGIGTLCIQALNTLGAEVWAVSSGAKVDLVRKLGAKHVFDRNKKPFHEQIRDAKLQADIIFDFVGGRELEKRAMTVLKPRGKFITAVGPVEWIGEEKLGWWGITRMFGYILRRVLFSRLDQGKRYFMSAFKNPDFPRISELLIQPGNQAVVDSVIPLDKTAVADAIESVVAHRTTGRVVIGVASA